MSVNSRLRNCEKSLKGRELALLWLKISQARGGFLEYWKTGEFQSWVSENDEAGLLYHLAFEANGAVLMAADGWRAIASWAGLLGVFLIMNTPPRLIPIQLSTAEDFLGLWRQKLCAFLADVVALQRAVDLTSEVYFDGHDVLFADVKERLTASHENANSLVVAYNYFAAENGKETVDVDVVECCPGRKVEELLNEWVMLSRSSALVARGRLFDARDEVLSWFGTNDPVAD
jgi:hypothetical protein